MRHLPTNGGGPAITAVLGNNVNFFMSPTSIALANISSAAGARAGNFGTERSKDLPDVPTLKELGYDIEYYFWVGLFAPKGTPARFSIVPDGLEKAARSQQFIDAIENLGQELDYLGSAGIYEILGSRRKRPEDAMSSIGCVQGIWFTGASGCGRDRRFILQPRDELMTFHADHVAGAFFLGLGLLVIALSGDLPSGTLSCLDPASCRR